MEVKLSDDPLEKFCQIKSLTKYLESQMTEDIIKEVEAKILDSEDKKLTFKNFQLEIREKSDYNYESANHPEYNVIAGMIKKWNEKKKALETFIKKIPNHGIPYTTSTGEKITINKADKTTKHTIYFTEKQ